MSGIVKDDQIVMAYERRAQTHYLLVPGIVSTKSAVPRFLSATYLRPHRIKRKAIKVATMAATRILKSTDFPCRLLLLLPVVTYTQ